MTLDRIIQGFSSSDTAEQEAAAKELTALQKSGIDTAVGLQILNSATREFPPRRSQWQNSAADLIRVVARDPKPEYLDEISRLFASYNREAKAEALGLLAGLPSRRAATTYIDLLKAHASQGEIARLVTWPLEKQPRHADIFFPALLDYATVPEFEWNVFALCLKYFEHSLLALGSLNSSLPQVLACYLKHKSMLAPAQRAQGVNWMWEDEYHEHRNIGALILELLGYFPSPDAFTELRAALEYQDPRLKHFALISLLRLRENVGEVDIADVARSPEMRNWLYRKLEELDRLTLYPDEYRTQEAFAESDMVNWLTFPSELGRVPDEIELAKAISVDTGDDTLLYFVFRFRTHVPHWAANDGWMAGVSGPFLKAEAPSPKCYGETFSAFSDWESQTPEEHLGEIHEIIARWREHRTKRQDTGGVAAN